MSTLQMVLRMFVANNALREKYEQSIAKHNNNIHDEYCDAGFDLFVPEGRMLDTPIIDIDYQVKCEATMQYTSQSEITTYPTGFYMYPRSSLSKTRLRLANSVGIIDSGYRGNLIGAFDALDDYGVQAGDRLVQVCAPGLVPIMVTVVDDLGDATARGSGGFGSTGRGTYGS